MVCMHILPLMLMVQSRRVRGGGYVYQDHDYKRENIISYERVGGSTQMLDASITFKRYRVRFLRTMCMLAYKEPIWANGLD